MRVLNYQDRVLTVLDAYLAALKTHKGNADTMAALAAERGIPLPPIDFTSATWDQMAKPFVGGIEVFRANAAVVCLPGITGFVRAARIKGRHVGIKSRDDLDDVEPFFFPISGELFEFVGPVQPMA